MYINVLEDFDVIMERNKQRAKETGKFIPEDVILQMMKSYQFPLIGEDERIIKIINVV